MGKWEMVRLGDVTHFNMGQSPSSESYNDVGEGMPFFQGKSDFGLMYPSVRIYCTDPKKIAQKGNILISVRAPVGAVNIATETCCIGRGLAAISQVERLSDFKYIYYYLKYKEIDISNMGVGSTFKAISKKDLDAIEIHFPPLRIQQQIADVLDRASALIEKRKAQIAKLDLLVKSQFIKMFGDPVTNPMGWETESLGTICNKLTDGTHFSPESYPSGDYKYITAKNIKLGGFDFSNLTYVDTNVHNQIYSRCNPEFGDVLYIKDGVTTGIAMVNTLQEPFTMLSSVALLKHNRSIVTGEYLCGVLNNQKMYVLIRDNMGGAAITRLTITKLNHIVLPIPPLSLQIQFADFVGQVETQKSLLQQSLAKLEQNYKSLMQKCFRGEIF